MGEPHAGDNSGELGRPALKIIPSQILARERRVIANGGIEAERSDLVVPKKHGHVVPKTRSSERQAG
jgi:hypothetical protein